MKKLVWAKIPRAGLANKILVWANAQVFAKQNGASIVTTNWVTLFIGPILRREQSLRFYRGYFKQDSLWKKFFVRVYARLGKSRKNIKSSKFPEKTRLVIFDHYMDWLEFFDRINQHRVFVKELFLNQLLKPKYLQFYLESAPPQIGVHVRMGDFGKIGSSEAFNHETAANKQTPISYFVHIIEEIRAITEQPSLPVHLFSDGNSNELQEILNLNNITLVKGNKDIEDLLLLSKSKVIVTSASSTFSLFAAYISDAIILHHPNFFIRKIRGSATDNLPFEGILCSNEKLKRELKNTVQS